jgi:F-type H+-transporting ATPase subunit b
MMRRLTQFFITIGILAAMFAGVPRAAQAHAQEPSKPATTTAEQGREVTPESAKEAKHGDTEANSGDAMRNSPAVKWLAQKTGMSVNAEFWLCLVLNFAVIAFFVAYLMRKNLPGFFKGRSEAISARIEQARKTSEEARQRLQQVEARLSRLDAEVSEMRREAEENSRTEAKRIMAEAENERRRIVTSAEQEIAAAANSARRDLKAYAASLAVDLAEKKIRVGQEADHELVRAFTSRLGKDGK